MDNFDEVCYRACAVMCHEIGHLFNLRHCVFYYCLMNGSNSLEEAKRKPFQLCPICLRKLMLGLKGEPREWLKRLVEAFMDIGVGSFKKNGVKIGGQMKQLFD